MNSRLTALLLALVANPVFAQSTDFVRLAPGEIPLRIMAEGKVRTPADTLTLFVPITGTGATAAAAREAARQRTTAVTAALNSQGVEAAAIVVTPATGPLGFIGNETDDDLPIGTMAAMTSASSSSPRQVAVVLRVRLSDPGMLERVQRALDAMDQPIIGGPRPALRDDRVARQQAIAAATVKARQEADAYAGALGLRVARVLAIGNAVPSSSDTALGWTIYAAMQGGGVDTAVETQARIQIDYALAPR